jgi:hypothetical protein
MTEIQDGERILRELIYEAAGHGLMSKEEAEELNDDLEELTGRLRDVYDRDGDSDE